MGWGGSDSDVPSGAIFRNRSEAGIDHPGGNPGANFKSNLPQMPPDSGGICMGVD